MGIPWGNFFRIRWVFSVLAAAVAGCLVAFPPVGGPSGGVAAGPELIVQLDPRADAGQVRELIDRAGGRVTRDLHLINGLGVRLDRQAASRLARHRGVRFVSPNATVAPTSDLSRLETAFNQSIRSPQLWRRSPRSGSVGAGVGVAVIDTGIDRDLPDFRVSQRDSRSRVVASIVVNPDARSAGDRHGHGTHVAGIIGGNGAARPARDPLHGRYVGVAPGADLISIKASDDEGNATTLDVIEGLQFAVDHKEEFNIRVANLSLSEDTPQPYKTNPLNAAVEQAWNAGIVVVAAAGNRGTAPDAVDYAPGNDPFVITVGASDDRATVSRRDDVAAGWSSAGTTRDGHAKPDLLAPGAHITSTLAAGSAITSMCSSCVTANEYFRMGGTSMAAAVASGAVALMLGSDPELRPNEVKSAIRSNLWNVGGRELPMRESSAGSLLDVLAADHARAPERREPNSFEPNQLLDAGTGLIDYARSSWSRSSWSRSSWSRSSWSASFAK
jgi:serine protease AprX